MLSLTCKYAIKAVIYLASKQETHINAGVKEIAEYIDASGHTVGKLLQKLVKEGVINSVKGPSGGFYITARQLGQPIMVIVKAIDGENVFKECGLGLSRCSSTHPCPIHNDYKKGRDIMEALFLNNRINDLYKPVSKGLAHLVG